MKLSMVVSRYFDDWIDNDSWDSDHKFDRERFYRFVKAVARYSRNAPSHVDIQELVMERWSGKRIRKNLLKTANYYSSLYQNLLEYERTTDFPNAMIARTNILDYYNRLIREYEIIRQGSRRQKGPNEHRIDNIMTSFWGTTWRTKLKETEARKLQSQGLQQSSSNRIATSTNGLRGLSPKS